MITSEVASAITEYKRRERLIRQKLANGLLIDLDGLGDATQLDVQTLPGGDITPARDFYLAQLGSKPEFAALIDALRANVAQKHALLWQAQQIDPSIFFGKIPPLE